MLQKLIHKISYKSHPWRSMQFDELAEIYTSMSIRGLGFSIIGIFVPIYLYRLGVDLQSIFWFFMWIFILRIPFSILAAHIVGRVGPKHAIAMSTLLFILFLATLLTYESVGWPLITLSLMFTISNGLFFIGYNTDFSKVKDSKNGGKELGWLYIFERVGGALGPLIGGVLATFVGAEFTIVFAIAVLLASLVPLFLSNEPVKLHQNIRFKGFPWRRHIRDFTSLAGLHVENIASIGSWPLLVGITVFADGAYAKLGGLVAISMALSLLFARIIGKTIDNQQGLRLLRAGTIINAVIHIFRPIMTSTFGASLISITNELITLSYRMPLIKGFFDSADLEQGYRIVYLSLTEMTSATAKAMYFALMYIASYWYAPIDVLRWSFVGVGIFSLFILSQRFPALKKP